MVEYSRYHPDRDHKTWFAWVENSFNPIRVFHLFAIRLRTGHEKPSVWSAAYLARVKSCRLLRMMKSLSRWSRMPKQACAARV